MAINFSLFVELHLLAKYITKIYISSLYSSVIPVPLNPPTFLSSEQS